MSNNLRFKHRSFNPQFHLERSDLQSKPNSGDNFHSFNIPSHEQIDTNQYRNEIKDLKRQMLISENHVEFLKQQVAILT